MRFTQIILLTSLFLSIQSFSQQIIVFQDTLGVNPVGWKFRNSSPHDWKWYANEGVNNGGGLRMKLPNDSNYIATPLIALQAGKTYTASFKSRMDQGTTTRKVKLGFNTRQFLGGTSFFHETYLPTNSYAEPLFTEYNPTFSVPISGNYCLIFDYEENDYSFTYFDELVIEETIYPTTSVTFPANNSSFNEGTDITLTAAANDADGSITKVEFFANGKKLAEDLTAPYEYTWINILPNDYQITTKATDNRGNSTVSSILNFRMNFRDGTFSKYVHWNFDASTGNRFDYWTLKNGDFKTRTGWEGTPCFEIFSAYANCFAASPGVFLRAGETYNIEMVGDASGTKNPRLLINSVQDLGGTFIDTVRFTSTDDFNLLKRKTFTVPTDGTYYFILNYPIVDNYIQVKFDNIRIIGNLDIPPVALMAAPDRNITIAENSSMKLRATPISPEDKAISKIEYYANGNKICESNTAPFECTWQNIPVGTYQIAARPYDIDNRSAFSTTITTTTLTNQFSAASILGTSLNDEIRGAVIQKNGTIILAANVGEMPDYEQVLLNGATNSTQGSLIRLASDGRSVLSITRFTDKVVDIARDSSDNLYVAAGAGGYFKLNPMTDAIIWNKTLTKLVHRVDAGQFGNSVILTSSTTNFDINTLTDVTCYIYDKDGNQLATTGGASQYTPDVAIDDASQTVIILGFKNFNTFDSPTGTQTLPVYVPVVRGLNYDGTTKYVGYNWGSDRTQPDWLNRSANNMADVRTSRAAIGQDGKLYITFEVFGGNHVLRYSPFDIMTTVPIVGGDFYFNFSNTGTETKTFVGRYEPATGNYILGQQFTARLITPPYRGNTIFARNGNVAADSTGRVYLTGKSASGLPQTIDYQPGEYTGGAYVLVLSPNLATREVCVRLTNGEGRFVAVQNQNRWIYGGNTTNPSYLAHPIQPSQNLLSEGFWGVIDNAPCAKNHVLGNNYLNSPNQYKAENTIISSHQLNSGIGLNYKAQKSVLLEKGFEAKTGSVFKAEIGGCN
jgi:Bacterial Ig domain